MLQLSYPNACSNSDLSTVARLLLKRRTKNRMQFGHDLWLLFEGSSNDNFDLHKSLLAFWEPLAIDGNCIFTAHDKVALLKSFFITIAEAIWPIAFSQPQDSQPIFSLLAATSLLADWNANIYIYICMCMQISTCKWFLLPPHQEVNCFFGAPSEVLLATCLWHTRRWWNPPLSPCSDGAAPTRSTWLCFPATCGCVKRSIKQQAGKYVYIVC